MFKHLVFELSRLIYGVNAQTEKRIKKNYGQPKIYPDGFSVKEVLHNKGSGLASPIIQDKPWGAEIWLIYSPKYALKHIIVEKGKRFSLQKHTEKMETWYISRGNPTVTLDDKKFEGAAGQILHVDPGTAHRIEAIKNDVEFWEVSTPQLWDVTRLEDDYGR